MEVDNKPINFDVNRIKVTVAGPIETSKYPLVRLKRLTRSEIAELTNIRIDSSEENIAQKSKISHIITSKRKSEVTFERMTRSKKQKQFEGMSLPTSGSAVFEYTCTDKKPQTKRKSNIESSELTAAKKPKNSEMGLPRTECIQLKVIEKQISTARTMALRSSTVAQSKFYKPTEKETAVKENVAIETVAKEAAAEKSKISEIGLPIRSTTLALNDFCMNEVVWGKLKGWPHWPARVTAIEGRRYELYWFNDFRKSKVYRTQLFKFAANFETFSKHFSTSFALAKAAQEAITYLAYKA